MSLFFFFSSKFSSVFSNPTLDHLKLKGYSNRVLQGSGRGKFYLWCQMLLTCLSLWNSIHTEFFFVKFLQQSIYVLMSCLMYFWWAEITNPLREVWFYLYSYSLKYTCGEDVFAAEGVVQSCCFLGVPFGFSELWDVSTLTSVIVRVLMTFKSVIGCFAHLFVRYFWAIFKYFCSKTTFSDPWFFF